MRISRKLVIGTATLALVGTAGGAALATAGGPAAQPAGPNVQAAVAAAIDTSTESKFTPVAPCRIVDTRVAGGRIAAGASRGFVVAGTTLFATQGGKPGGCGVPGAATAVAVSVMAPGATGAGTLRLWPYGTPEPATAFLSFTNLFNASSGGTAGINAAGVRDLRVKANGRATHVVIDVNGYYVKPMAAELSGAGALLRGSRVTGVQRLGTGQYQVTFDRNVSQCAYHATTFLNPFFIATEPRSGNANAVFVYTQTSAGVGADQRFYLTVTC